MTSTVRSRVSGDRRSREIRPPGRERSTTAALVAAARSLLLARAWERISVRLLCDTAGVSRSTFYAHFDDKQDLLGTVFDALRAHLGGEVAGRGLDSHGNLRFLPALLDHMQGHLPLFERNGRSPAGLALHAQFKRVVETLIRDEIARSALSGAVCDDRRAFIAGGIFGIVERWCGDGCERPVRRVLGCLDDLVRAALTPSSDAGTGDR